MERIKSAAIKYRLASEPNADKIVYGHDHAYCNSWFMLAEIYPNQRISEVEGFLTTSGRFVDRHEAYDIAKNAGQLKMPDPINILKSYNVKYETSTSNKETDFYRELLMEQQEQM